jgi:NAD(P)-dependent dehydrogenase (short-subunit alcohol dehydrogenase family)
MSNAAWQGEINPMVNYPFGIFDQGIGMNVRGVFLGLRSFFTVMIKLGKGVALNAAPYSATMDTRNLSRCTASKHVVMGLAQTTALKLRVKVYAAIRGSQSQWIQESYADIEPSRLKSKAPALSLRKQRSVALPEGRCAGSCEVVNFMACLASDFASHVTLQSVRINGGSDA